MKSWWSALQQQAKDGLLAQLTSDVASGANTIRSQLNQWNPRMTNSGHWSDGTGDPDVVDGSSQGEPLIAKVQAMLAPRSHGIRQYFSTLGPDQYTTSQEVRIWASTFNVNGTKPRLEDDLRSWLMFQDEQWPKRPGAQGGWKGPDILFAGFQEINALSAMTVMSGGSDESVMAWETALRCALNQAPLPQSYFAAQEALAALGALGAATTEPGTTFDPNRPAFGVGQVREDLAPEEEYVHIGGHRMVGIYLSVWARKPIAQHISAVQGTEVRTGSLGFGNKGAVAVRLRVYDEEICVMCAHMASGEQPGDDLKRKTEFLLINREATFPLEVPEGTPQGHMWIHTHKAATQPNVILMGDFNFRLNMSDAEVRRLLRLGAFDRMLARDELVPMLGMEGASEGVFEGWKEQMITFPPSFKFVKGTDTYVGADQGEEEEDGGGGDPEQVRLVHAEAESQGEGGAGTSGEGGARPESARGAPAITPLQLVSIGSDPPGMPDPSAPPSSRSVLGRFVPPSPSTKASMNTSQKVRTPAWTDRVMYRSNFATERLHKLLYTSVNLALSDHKPVVATFLLNARVVDAERVHSHVEAAQKALDISANNAQPRCSISSNVHDVRTLRYNQTVDCSCTITNVGEAVAQWSLVADLQAAGGPAGVGTPSWIHVSPTHGVLAPTQSGSVAFKVGVQSPLSSPAQPGTAEQLVQPPHSCSLNHTFVIHIDQGADHFVVVDGVYEPSFFGLTPQTMRQHLPGPDMEELRFDEGSHVLAGSKCPYAPQQWLVVPPQLQRMLHHLARDDCLQAQGIFSDSFQLVRTDAALALGSALDDSGLLPAVNACASAIDEGRPFAEDVSAHDVAATFLSYFKALPHPLFPDKIASMCTSSVPDAQHAAGALKEALGSGEEWALLCCTIQLLQLIVKVQTRGSMSPRTKLQIREGMAQCFAEAWFPAISIRNFQEEDYTLLVQRAAETSSKQAYFVQMFLA